MVTQTAAWAVIGAGPAGIAMVAKLIKDGIPASDIIWFDPHFQAGDLSRYWSAVSSNTIVELFQRYFEHYPCMQYEKIRTDCQLDSIDKDTTCQLAHVSEVLIKVTAVLKQQVQTVQTNIDALEMTSNQWTLVSREGRRYFAKKVVLAIGSTPKQLTLHNAPPEIPLFDALDFEKLKCHCKAGDSIAVFGSSHSAVLIMRDLMALGVNVINFFRHSLKYAVKLDGWTLFDNTGLKGDAAKWARMNMGGNRTDQLTQLYSEEKNLSEFLPKCDKLIQAVGFETRNTLNINGLSLQAYPHNQHNGIIAPGLFGLGIAYPERVVDALGNVELAVGMWKFVDYLERIMPIWRAYHC